VLTVRRHRRASFTLIELLVVIAIIGILMTLAASSIAKFLGVQPTNNTRTELKQLNIALTQKLREVNDAAGGPQEQAFRDAYFSSTGPGAALPIAGGNPATAAARIIFWKKLRQKQAFPQSFYEVFTAPTVMGLQPIPGYVDYLKQYGITAAAATNPVPQPYESGICLLMSLRRSVAGGVAIADDKFTPFVKFITVTGATKPVPCLVDGWKNPIMFCRWPLGNSQADLNDTTDTDNVLGVYAGNATMQGMLHPFSATPKALRLTPLIASSGPDGKPGLTFATPGTATDWTDTPPDANDNIYSNNLP
jgi:prepilin-type N-terminal cleavage/methylation domain-containing protein